MGETDHLYVRPPPLLASPTQPAAFPFHYIEPAKHRSVSVCFVTELHFMLT